MNRVVTNKIVGPAARRLPWFAVLEHTGRSSGRAYTTPLMAWRTGARITVALTYGPDVDWLKNARAADSVITMSAVRYAVGKPEFISEEEGRRMVPAVVRAALSALNVDRFAEFPILNPPSS